MNEMLRGDTVLTNDMNVIANNCSGQALPAFSDHSCKVNLL